MFISLDSLSSLFLSRTLSSSLFSSMAISCNLIIASSNQTSLHCIYSILFDLFQIPTPRVFAQRVEYCRVKNLVVEQVPLKYGPPKPPVEAANRDYAKENVILRSVIDELKNKNEDNMHEIKALKNELLEIYSKITYLECNLGIEHVDTGNLGSNKDVINLVDDENDTACAGTVFVTANLPNLTDFNYDLGIVVAVTNVSLG